jgi:hypothetical protein
VPWFRTEDERVADALEKTHDEILRIARQLDAHAELAPYPQVSTRLHEIRAAEEKSARAIADRMIALGRQPSTHASGAVRGGQSCWARLVVDVEDYRSLLRQLSQLWVRWDDEHPEDAALVRRVLDESTISRDALNDLVARSDPHAFD